MDVITDLTCKDGTAHHLVDGWEPTHNRSLPAQMSGFLAVSPGSRVWWMRPGGDITVARDAVWVSNPATATVRRIDPRRNQVTDDLVEADGSDLTVAANGVVWATSDTRLLGLGGSEVLGPRRNLHELGTDRITAVAAARDGGLWLGTAQGLFHVTRSVLREG